MTSTYYGPFFSKKMHFSFQDQSDKMLMTFYHSNFHALENLIYPLILPIICLYLQILCHKCILNNYLLFPNYFIYIYIYIYIEDYTIIKHYKEAVKIHHSQQLPLTFQNLSYSKCGPWAISLNITLSRILVHPRPRSNHNTFKFEKHGGSKGGTVASGLRTML